MTGGVLLVHEEGLELHDAEAFQGPGAIVIKIRSCLDFGTSSGLELQPMAKQDSKRRQAFIYLLIKS